MGLGTIFDRIFASCDFWAKKPDEVFFRTISRNIEYDGISRIVFFDDREPNVLAVLAAGWEGVVYSSIKDFRKWNIREAEPHAAGNA